MPVIMNKLMGRSTTNLYHATYTNSLAAIAVASVLQHSPLTKVDLYIGCATELTSLIISNSDLSALASPILCMISSFGPVPLLILLFVSPRVANSTLGSKRTRTLLAHLGLSQLLGCTSSALKAIKPTTWILFSIRMAVLLQTALSMLIFHGRNTIPLCYYLDLLLVDLIKLRVGRRSSDAAFKLRQLSQPSDLVDSQDHNLSCIAPHSQRPRTHLSRNSQASFPKSSNEVGWKWPGPPQRLLVLEPVRTSSISTVGKRTSINEITKKPEMNPFNSTRPNSFDSETILRVGPQPPSQPCTDPKHEPIIRPDSQEATPRASQAYDVDS